jgi:hypothetical protein
MSFSSTTFQNFPRISDLLSEASKFQRQTQQYSKCVQVTPYTAILKMCPSSNAIHSSTQNVSKFQRHIQQYSKCVQVTPYTAILKMCPSSNAIHSNTQNVSKLRHTQQYSKCVQVPTPHTAIVKIQHFSSFFLKFKSNLLVQKASSF